MNNKIKKILMIGIPVLLLLCAGIVTLSIILGKDSNVTISYSSADTSKGIVSIQEETVKTKDDAAGATATPKTGYSFVNWTKDGNEVSKEAQFIPEKVKGKNIEATYVANFEANKYKATFSGNFEGSTYSSVIEQTYGEKHQFPTINPERENYNFIGFFDNAGNLVTKDMTFDKTSDVTLLASWSGKKYNVTFVGNFEGSEYSTTIEEIYGSNYILPSTDPEQDLYTFNGWFTDASEGTQITAESIVELTSDITLYAHWESSCVAEGTLITMRDGSTKTVELIEIGDEIRTFNHETGELSYSEVCFVWETLNASDVFALYFEDGTSVTIIEEHGFYDGTIRKYAFINYDNANEYVGHEFYNGDTNSFVKLVSYERVHEQVNAYAIVTKEHLNHMANGMLSMSDGIMVYIANMFEYDEDMSFSETDVENSINAYGLYDKNEFLDKYQGWSSEEFDDYNLEYLSIAIGKGILTLEELEAINAECIAYNEILNELLAQ